MTDINGIATSNPNFIYSVKMKLVDYTGLYTSLT